MKRWQINTVLVVMSFLLGLIVAPSKDVDSTYRYGIMDFINHDRILWGNEAGIIGVLHKNEESDDVSYFVDVELLSIGENVKLEISEIEYKILFYDDTVMVHYVFDTDEDKLLYAQLIRDENGRLDIDFKKPVVVLDAGHGGFDKGDGSNELWLEKDMTLKMTMMMKEYLEKGGIRVVLTRIEDKYITLYDRCAVSNYVEPDMFISNHINRFDGWSSGIDVLYSLKSDESFAYELAEAISKAGMGIHSVNYRRDIDHPELDYYLLHHNNDSESYIIEYGYADYEPDAAIIAERWDDMVEYASQAVIRRIFSEPVITNSTEY